MGCRKLSYYEGEGSEEKSPLKFFSGLEEKNDSSIFCIDYSPFGLTFNSYSRSYSTAQNFLFNEKELQPETGWLDFGPRMYMPELGRWGVIDPAADAQLAFSPYHFAYNNPIRFNDPTGLIGEDFMQGLATTFVNEDTGETYEVDDGYDFEFSVSGDEFEEVKKNGGAKGTSVYNRWFWSAVGHELKTSNGDTSWDQLLQFLFYDDIGDGVISASEGQYTAAALGLMLSRLKIGKGSKLVKKLFKYGKKSKLPTPDLAPDQFKPGNKAGEWIHKKTGAIFSKSKTSHGNAGNAGDQWKAWSKGTTEFGNASKKAGNRVTIDGTGNVIGN